MMGDCATFNFENQPGTSIDIKTVLHSCSNAPIEVD